MAGALAGLAATATTAFSIAVARRSWIRARHVRVMRRRRLDGRQMPAPWPTAPSAVPIAVAGLLVWLAATRTPVLAAAVGGLATLAWRARHRVEAWLRPARYDTELVVGLDALMR